MKGGPAALLIALGKKARGGRETDSEKGEAEPSGYDLAVKEFMDAVKSGDKKAAGSALRNAVHLCGDDSEAEE